MNKDFRPRPHVSVFRLKTQLFLCGYGFRPHASDENDHWKWSFSITLSRVELFENAVFASTCGWTKRELFENADHTLSVPIHSVQYYHNLVNLFKMPERCFTSLSLILGLISNLIACFQADLALLFLQAYYIYPNKRWRQFIISRVHNTEYSCVEHAQ